MSVIITLRGLVWAWLSRERERERERERGSALRKVPIVSSVYHLYQSFHECLIASPKSERYSLGATCQSEILELLRLSLRAAGSTKPSDKAAYIKEASVRLDSLRLLLNLCKDCKCVSNQTYQQLDSTCNEIGRMLGGWLNLSRAVPDRRRQPVVIPVVSPVVVQLQLAVVVPPVEVRNVRPVGIAQSTIRGHWVQTHPNSVFYTRYISLADCTECSIFCLHAYLIRK